MQTAGGRTDDYDLRTVRGRVGGSVARYRVDTRAARRAWSRGGGGGGLARSQSPSVTTGRAKRARGTEHRTSSEAVEQTLAGGTFGSQNICGDNR